MDKQDILIDIDNLHTSFLTESGEVEAVRGVGFKVAERNTLGLVGESGCGKSVTALSIMRLVPYPGFIKKGRIVYRGTDLLKLSDEAMRGIRGKEIAMIFQEPMTALNPVFTIGNQIVEAIRLHQGIGKKEATNRTVELLKLVGMPSPEDKINTYPHQLSGGMRQRAMIAMALSCEPSLLIADEPTTALDVTIQAQILSLIKELKVAYKMSMILITHDLGVIAEVVDDVAVMYAGRIIEYADKMKLFHRPLHPYTIGLLNCIPKLDEKDGIKKKRLNAIPGSVPRYLSTYRACSFKERCPVADRGCSVDEPELKEVEDNHWVACLKI